VLAGWWQSPLAHARCNAELGLFLARYALAAGAPPPEADDLAARAERLMHERHPDGVTLAAIARALEVSERRLDAAVRARRGVAPGKLLPRIRLEAACGLLKATDQPAAEIAGKVGYRDPSAFGRAFRTAFGTSPEQWRRRQRR